MYYRKERRKPFRPSASYQGLSKEPQQLPIEIEDIDEKRQKFIPGQKFYDAETGEEIGLTQAKWSAKEGRLDLDAHTILIMGTGKLDIKNRVANRMKQGNNEDENIIENSQPEILSPTKRHPLVQKFLDIGPLTPMFNSRWNPLTNEIEIHSDVESLDSLPDKQHRHLKPAASFLPPITPVKVTPPVSERLTTTFSTLSLASVQEQETVFPTATTVSSTMITTPQRSENASPLVTQRNQSSKKNKASRNTNQNDFG